MTNNLLNLDGRSKTNPLLRSSTTQYLITNASDEILVISAQNGDQTAFNTLIRRYREDAFKLAHRILFKPNGRIDAKQSAEDVLQEASWRAWKYIKSCNPQAQFRAWFRGIVRNECKRLFADLAENINNIDIYTDIESIEDYGDWMISEKDKVEYSIADPETEGEIIEKEREKIRLELAEYMKLIGNLPTQQRSVMELRLEGHSYKQIAKKMNTTVTNVGFHLSAARKSLRKIVKIEPSAAVVKT